MPKALTESERQDKATHIKVHALELFATMGYDELKMETLASHCGVAKGTLFNYFATKETLFLVLFAEAYEAFCQGLMKIISDAAPLEMDTFAPVLNRYIQEVVIKDQAYLKLLSLTHSRLEHNVGLDEATRFREILYGRMKDVGLVMAENIKGMTLVKGIKLMMSLHTMMIGHVLLATLPRTMEDHLDAMTLDHYSMDLALSLEENLRTYLHGLVGKRL